MNAMPRTHLHGCVAVITGGRGAIGWATARRLAELGARIVSVDRREREAVQQQLQTLPKPLLGHLAITASVTDSVALMAAAAQVKARFGRCDVLVNCAGFTRPVAAADLDGLDDALFDEVIATNLRGVYASIRAFAPLLKATGDALVVNVSSIAGFTGAGSNLAYAAAKAGVDVITKGLGRALAPQVRVLSVSPGVVDTAFVPGRDAAFNDKAARTIPLGRVAVADDIAAAIEACATTMRYATGTRLVIDGGRSL